MYRLKASGARTYIPLVLELITESPLTQNQEADIFMQIGTKINW